MNTEDRNKIDLIQLGEMYGKVNSFDDKFDGLGKKIDDSMTQTGKVLVKLDKRLDRHDKRITWNMKRIFILGGIVLGGGGIWEFIIK